MCEWGNNVVLCAPERLYIDKNRREVAVDECIAKTISHLWWKHRVETLSSCCGHGKTKPSLVVPEHYTENQIEAVYQYIREVDDREWQLWQWRKTCMEVNEDGTQRVVPPV